jgi:hypothetical protein
LRLIAWRSFWFRCVHFIDHSHTVSKRWTTSRVRTHVNENSHDLCTFVWHAV